MAKAASTTPDPLPPAIVPAAAETKPELDPIVDALRPSAAEVADAAASLPPVVVPPAPPTPEEQAAAAAFDAWHADRTKLAAALDAKRDALIALEYPAPFPASDAEAEADAIAGWCGTRNEDVRVSGNTWLEPSVFRGVADIIRQRKYRGQ